MDDLLELVFDIVMDIIGAVVESERVPIWLRDCLVGVLLAGLVGLLLYGILQTTDVLLITLLAILALALVALAVFLVYKIHRSGTLRLAKREELPAILRMYRSVIGKSGCNWSVTYPNEVTLYDDFHTGNLYVLCRGKKILGAGSIVPKNELDDLDCWYYREQPREIARIVIAPEHQGKGYGKQLVNKLCHKLEYTHCQVVHLLVSTENHHAQNLYRETGFYNKGQCQRYDHDYYAFERKL